MDLSQIPNSSTPATNPEDSTNAFLQQQTIPSIGSKQAEQQAGPQPNPSPGGMPPPPPPPPGYKAPEGANPIFEAGSEEPEQTAMPGNNNGNGGKSKEYKQLVVKGFINAEDFFTASICGAIADVPASEFRAGEEEKEELLKSLEPFIEWIVDTCPAWLPMAAMYGMMKGHQIIKTVKIVKENNKREAAAKKQATYQPLKEKVAAEAAKGVRKNFKLHKSGAHYYNDADGNYVKQEDPKERPSIDDIAAICAANSVDLVAKAFPQLYRSKIEALRDEAEQ